VIVVVVVVEVIVAFRIFSHAGLHRCFDYDCDYDNDNYNDSGSMSILSARYAIR